MTTARTVTPTYDADGNLTGDGVWRYEWDGENRLTAMQLQLAAAEKLFPLTSPTSGTLNNTDQRTLRLEFGYDSIGRRIGKRVLGGVISPLVINPPGGGGDDDGGAAAAGASNVGSALGGTTRDADDGTGGTPIANGGTIPPASNPPGSNVSTPPPITVPGQPNVTWTLASWRKYLYDISGSAGQWNLSLSANCDAGWGNLLTDSAGRDMSYAWGPDMSGSVGGAGGIGGLAIITDDARVWLNSGTSASSATTSNLNDAKANGINFPVYDGNGNIMRLWGSGGANLPLSFGATAKYSYGPFGEPLGMTGLMAGRNPFRFSTKFTDAETGLLYYGYRYYSPSLGRWISRDPIGEDGGVNIISFNQNAPTFGIDFLGLLTQLWFGTHPVAGGNHHSKLWIVTDDEEVITRGNYEYHPAQSPNLPAMPSFVGPCNIYYLTIGAGPSSAAGAILGGDLVADFNRPLDKSLELHTPALITTFSDPGVVRAFEERVQQANVQMNRTFRISALYYELFPRAVYSYSTTRENRGGEVVPWAGFNSNSYISGLLRNFGYATPQPPVVVPGYDKPVPKVLFNRRFFNDAALRSYWRAEYP